MNKKTAIQLLTQTLIIGSLVLSQAQAEVITGNDLNSADSTNARIADIYSANRGTNGGGDQSLQFGDIIEGTAHNDLLIGGLGIDVLFGKEGDDIIIGGTEDFNSFNRDRAFGQEGEDIFLWAPGDGNDFFDGGPGLDVVFLSLIGESKNAKGDTKRAPFFAVNPPGTKGSQDFDGIHEVTPGTPIVNFFSSPGFCEIVERDIHNKAGLDELGLDHLVRFILRGPRANFLANPDRHIAPEILDDGLRIALHLNNVEYLVCSDETVNNEPRIFDLTQVPAQEIDASNLPARAAELVQHRARPIIIEIAR